MTENTFDAIFTGSFCKLKTISVQILAFLTCGKAFWSCQLLLQSPTWLFLAIFQVDEHLFMTLAIVSILLQNILGRISIHPFLEPAISLLGSQGCQSQPKSDNVRAEWVSSCHIAWMQYYKVLFMYVFKVFKVVCIHVFNVKTSLTMTCFLMFSYIHLINFVCR